MEQQKREEHYAKKILDLIEESGEYTFSDLQGIITALVRTIARDTDLLDFEERLERAKEQDLY